MERTATVKIRMLKAYAAYRKGEIMELPEQQAASLIAWDYAQRVEERQQTLIETAAVEANVETADVTPRRKRQ